MRRSILLFCLCGITLFFSHSCVCGIAQHKENIAVPNPDSFRIENVDPFNARIEEATNKGESWAGDPILIILNLLKISSSDARSIVMAKESSLSENPDRTTVSILRDGLLDDSIRGDWHYFELRKMNDQGWRFTEIRRAFLCRRGIQTEKLGKELCP